MNYPSTSMRTTVRGEQCGESNTHLQGRRLILAWVFWGVIALIELAALVYSLTGAVMQLQVLCTSSCAIQLLSADVVKTLQHAGLSLGDYIAFYIAAILISTLLCYTIAAVLLWHRFELSYFA
jgi:hypothetical protein